MVKLPVVQIEDDSRYLAVVHPYPLNPNLHLPADRRTLALWLACCTGKDVIRAMFHKRTSAGMVIIQVDHEFENWDALLGLHSWSEFLLAPTTEEADKSSKVFFCTYSTGKALSDAGWNRVDVEEYWFQGWRPDNDTIRHPYPKRAYCDVPPEPVPGLPICCPLPQDYFPPPVPPPTWEPPVGPAEWLSAMGNDSYSNIMPSSRRRNQSAVQSDSISTITTTSSGSDGGAQSPSPPDRFRQDALWRRPSFPSLGSYLRASTLPPAVRPNLTEEDAPRGSTAEALKDLFDSAPSAASIRSDVNEGAYTHGAVPVRDQSPSHSEEAVEDGPWSGYTAPRSDPPTRVWKMGEDEWICPEHGAMCSPKICEAYARVETEERWEMEHEKRAKAKRERQERREQARRYGESGSDIDSDDSGTEADTPRDQGPYSSRAESADLPAYPPTSPSPGQKEQTQTADEPLPDTCSVAASVSVRATTSSVPVVPPEGGFPTFANTDWGDPIATAQSAAAGKSSANTGASARERRRRNQSWTDKDEEDAQASELSELNFEVLLPAGSPGGSWCDGDVVW